MRVKLLIKLLTLTDIDWLRCLMKLINLVKMFLQFDEIWLNLILHQLNETFIDSKYPCFVEFCRYLTKFASTGFLTMMKFFTLAKVIILMKFITLMIFIFLMKFITLMNPITLLKFNTLMEFITLMKFRLLMKSTTLFDINHIYHIFHHDENNLNYFNC